MLCVRSLAVMDSGQVAGEHSYSTSEYKPLYLQRIENSLSLESYLKASERLAAELASDSSDEDESLLTKLKPSKRPGKGDKSKITNGVLTSLNERKQIRQSFYCTSHLKYGRKWLKELLLSDSDSSDEEPADGTISEERLKAMLKEHKLLMKCRGTYPTVDNPQIYKDYSYGVLGQGKFPELKPPKKKTKTSTPSAKNTHGQPATGSTSGAYNAEELEDGEIVLPYGYTDFEQYYGGKESPASAAAAPTPPPTKSSKGKKQPTAEILLARRKKLWHSICKKEIPKAAKAKTAIKKDLVSNAKKCAVAIMKIKRREALASQKAMKDTQSRMRRASREMAIYWKRFEKVEKQQLKKVQKEAQEQRKADLELLEAKRATRKLNFLITQTELYAHFMAKKITGAADCEKDKILQRLDETETVHSNKLSLHTTDDYDADIVKEEIMSNVENAYELQTTNTRKFDMKTRAHAEGNLGLSEADVGGQEYPQPSIFVGKLKTYQVKGMNWLANLYSQGINGILADEMGLGKTVQSIAFLAHLAEVHGIWGPFLVVAPASTLHNWQQECARFLPKMRVVPYWGTTQERKILRKFWDQQNLHTEHASFHIVITSYQLVIQDMKYLQKVLWHYMILDEAQALKSSSSNRWKILLSFNCRNRLLLTGTPIQNSMAELWALLHFIMPTMFDSHEEFNEWFSKDIENHIENKSNIDQNHLSRLHMILKPFMLRRVKKDVENDLTDKIEILMYCPLTIRQRYLYDAIKRKIRIEDLLQTASSAATVTSSTTNSLMNLVMQFRKVCNHPELFERREIKSPLYAPIEPYYMPKLIYREGILVTSFNTPRHLLFRLLSLYNTEYVHRQIHQDESGLFSWLHLLGISPGELYKVMIGSILEIVKLAFHMRERLRISAHRQMWSADEELKSTSSLDLRIISPLNPVCCSNSLVMKNLVFTDCTKPINAHFTHSFYHMNETAAHRRIRMRHRRSELHSPTAKRKHSLRVQNKVSTTVVQNESEEHQLTKISTNSFHHEEEKLLAERPLQLTYMLPFLNHMIPKTVSPPLEMYFSDRSAEYDHVRALMCGSIDAKQMLLHGLKPRNSQAWHEEPAGGFHAVQPYFGFSNIFTPDKRSMIVDAGKMHILDVLLNKLKKEGHRVLIYSTMTKVIDLLEEFMWYRKHRYMRLDGSSKISDRRDMVSDFQSKADIFVFLLSTRAGGLGINLTAADTVIFYDSDWNPTVDAQAMDRAHRLGQTKQVTVYRLICKGTIEERILERAREKSEIQRMVISGGNTFKPDVLKPKEVVSLLIDDDSLKKRLVQAQENKQERAVKRKAEKAAKKQAEAAAPKVKKPRKNAKAAVKMEEINNSLTNSPSVDDLDVDILEDSSRTSSPAPSTAPSTPGLSTTPQNAANKRRGRPKGSKTSKPVVRVKGGLKKALTAAEIAGARAGMNAAYAACGYSAPSAGLPEMQSPNTPV